MLHPDDRLTFTDALRPPAGHRLDFALGATYSLDLETLLAAPAAFALQTVDVDDLTQLDALALLDSVRRNAKRILVVHQAGQMAVPRNHRLFAFLEGSVAAVTAPRGGVFHPKFWVLRYVDVESGLPRHRVIIASRNITGDRSWDVVLRLDSLDEAGGRADLSGLSQLIRALPGIATQEMPTDRLDEIEQLAAEIETASFVLPVGADALVVHPLGVNGHEAGTTPFPDEVERLLVISPFLSGPHLDALPQAKVKPILISRAESMDPLPNALGRFTTFVLDDAAADDRDELAVQTSEGGAPGTTLYGLHAKVYCYDQAGESHVLLGSANATTAAFTRNVEMLAQLVGQSSLLGVEAIIGSEPGDDERGSPSEASLRDLLVPYMPDALAVDGSLAPMSRMDALRKSIGTQRFAADVVGAGDRFTVTYRGAQVDLPAGVLATCFPITISQEVPLVDEGGMVRAVFTLSLESLTAFLGIHLIDGDEECSFVVPAVLHGVPEDRDRLVLKALLGNAERFVRYLLYLLADESMSNLEVSQLLKQVEASETNGTGHMRVDGAPVLEQMLRALRIDPERLRPVAELVNSLGDDTDLLPPGLLDIWEPIRVVAAERWR